jgi:Hydrolytic ATP binding site of dynein motor region
MIHASSCSILDAREFEWESQLRFYWVNEPDELMVRQCTGEFGYGYEYMGLNGRLVITPLTDRIYLTITQVDLTFSEGRISMKLFLLGIVHASRLCARFVECLETMSSTALVFHFSWSCWYDPSNSERSDTRMEPCLSV